MKTRIRSRSIKTKKLPTGEPIRSFEKPTLVLYGSAGCSARQAINRLRLAQPLRLWPTRFFGPPALGASSRVVRDRRALRRRSAPPQLGWSPIVASRESLQLVFYFLRRIFIGTCVRTRRRRRETYRSRASNTSPKSSSSRGDVCRFGYTSDHSHFDNGLERPSA